MARIQRAHSTLPVLPDFRGILGQERALKTLREAVSAERLHHAYIFEGPQGVGKSTVALQLAMRTNCAEVEAPCGKCPTCRQIVAGNHPDVIVLSPDPEKANPMISVGQIRDVIRTASFHRYSAKRRFIIINPASAMADTAANALLKTLEEPPEHTGFILVTEHAADLLPTIISRCQRVRFGAVETGSLINWLASQDIPDTQTLANLSLGCPGMAIALAQGDLKKRQALRDDLTSIIAKPAEHLFKWSQKLTTGPRDRWRPKVDLLLDLTEELLRDVVMLQANPEAELIHADIHHIIDAFRVRLYPEGVTAIAKSVTNARTMLRQYVNGRLVVDTLLSRIQVELGDPPR